MVQKIQSQVLHAVSTQCERSRHGKGQLAACICLQLSFPGVPATEVLKRGGGGRIG